MCGSKRTQSGNACRGCVRRPGPSGCPAAEMRMRHRIIGPVAESIESRSRNGTGSAQLSDATTSVASASPDT